MQTMQHIDVSNKIKQNSFTIISEYPVHVDYDGESYNVKVNPSEIIFKAASITR